jgi:hypothetical protein
MVVTAWWTRQFLKGHCALLAAARAEAMAGSKRLERTDRISRALGGLRVTYSS